MAYILTEDGLGRQVKIPVFNESEAGTSTWHVPVCDSSGYLKVSLQTVNSDVSFNFGTGSLASIIYETADANATALEFIASEGGATAVPAFIFGDASISTQDLGWFDGLTEPSIVVVNDAKDAYIKIDSGDDGVAASKGIYFKAAADEDIEIINASVTGTPRIFYDYSEDVWGSSIGMAFADGKVIYLGNAGALGTLNADSNTFNFDARDNAVGYVVVGKVVSAADPYIQVGRDDTGVALDAVTDMFVLQAGGGTGNEAANFGLGMSWKLGNAASEVEERGSIDLVLVTATNGAEDTRWDFSTMAGGAINPALSLSPAGVLSVDLGGSGSAAQVDLFDDYDDVAVLKQSIQQHNRQILVDMGIAEERADGKGHMVKVQPMMKLLAGGIYQSRQALEDLRDELNTRLQKLEAKIV